MKQKLFSAILVLALALSLAPATLAAGDTDGILTAGGNIKLTEDLALTGDVTITKDTVLDLDGHSITGVETGVEDPSVMLYIVSALKIANGATVTIKNGTLNNIQIDNYGYIKKLTVLNIVSPNSGEVVRNWNRLDEISRCTIVAKRSAIRDVSGSIMLIDNCDISVSLMIGVIFGANHGLMRHSRVVSSDDKWGAATAGGKGAVVIDDCILVGYSRGAMIANDGLAQIQNSVLINISTEWGVSKTAAIWLEGENANMTPPNLENCTLIAAEGACGYGVLETSTESKQVGVDDKGNPIYKDIENKSWVYHEKSDMINCTFLPLSTVDWKNYIAWEMEPASAEPETPKGLENFAAVNTYIPGQFTDIPKTHWGSANVEKSYELGLMKGSSDTGFNPDGNVSLAQAITMAARLNSIYTTGTEDFTQGTVWYQTYVDYAKQNGIPTDFTDYNATATRAEFAAILAAALPIESLEAINMVTDGIIPDVDMKDADTQAIYMLYRAGILTGNDSAGTFTPNSSITRAAAAAIITRMADRSLRKSITLSK